MDKDKISPWINVKDRLPDGTKKVLGGYLHQTGEWICNIACAFDFTADFYTHWMPLPEPPKENE